MHIRTRAFPLCLITLFLTGAAEAQLPADFSAGQEHPLLHHHLSVGLTPDTHEITAIDQIDLELEPTCSSLSFTLAPTLRIESIMMEAPSAIDTEGTAGVAVSFARMRSGEAASQQVIVTLPKDHSAKMRLTWIYRGIIHDPPREPRHLRFSHRAKRPDISGRRGCT